MTWVKLDDAILDNPKILAVGPVGFALHIAAIIYCARNLTDGFLPYARAATLIDVSGVHVDTRNPCAIPVHGQSLSMSGHDMRISDLITQLVGEGLWVSVDGGYEVHDYLEYNPSKLEVLTERERVRGQRSAAGKTSAAKRAVQRGQQRAGNENPTGGQRESNETANENPTRPPTEAQRESNPVPVPVPVPGEEKKTTPARGGLRRSDPATLNPTATNLLGLLDELADHLVPSLDRELRAGAAFGMATVLVDYPRIKSEHHRAIFVDAIGNCETHVAKTPFADDEQRLASLGKAFRWAVKSADIEARSTGSGARSGPRSQQREPDVDQAEYIAHEMVEMKKTLAEQDARDAERAERDRHQPPLSKEEREERTRATLAAMGPRPDWGYTPPKLALVPPRRPDS